MTKLKIKVIAGLCLILIWLISYKIYRDYIISENSNIKTKENYSEHYSFYKKKNDPLSKFESSDTSTYIKKKDTKKNTSLFSVEFDEKIEKDELSEILKYAIIIIIILIIIYI
jgi:hypothetical protein